MRRSLPGLLAVVAVAMSPALLHAQQGERSARWGVTASFTPHWTAATLVAHYVGADQYDISGSEFTIGFVRGRDYGGDWGLSFTWKSVGDGSTSRFGARQLCLRTSCVQESTTVVARSAFLLGVEGHRFFKVVSLGRRAHLGLNLAGGVLGAAGKTEKSEQYAGFEIDPAARSVVPVQRTRVSEAGGGQVFTIAKDVRYVPSVKVELGLGLVLTRNLKTRFSGGINFPGYGVFSTSLVYLFGRPGPQSIFR